ncbi:MAG: Triosephosphate isomerase 1 [Pseudomonadota bacterium]
MTSPIHPLVAGNWKMNGTGQSLEQLAAIVAGLDALPAGIDLLICPPATLIERASRTVHGSRLLIGGQNSHEKSDGAYTGEISAVMLVDCGASHVILGHSERRTLYAETSDLVCTKAEAALGEGLVTIICIGETETERRAGQALSIVEQQLSASVPAGARAATVVIAYEPVWAIGTGLTPTAAEVAEVHARIRALLVARFGSEGQAMRILYGGSVKASNARELLAIDHVDGALIGGASLKATDFLAIASAYHDISGSR